VSLYAQKRTFGNTIWDLSTHPTLGAMQLIVRFYKEMAAKDKEALG